MLNRTTILAITALMSLGILQHSRAQQPKTPESRFNDCLDEFDAHIAAATYEQAQSKIAHMRRLVRSIPNDKKEMANARVSNCQGILHIENGRYDEAASSFEGLLNQVTEPGYRWQTLCNLATAYSGQNRHIKARFTLKLAEPPKAISSINKAIYCKNLATQYKLVSRYEDALREFRAAEELLERAQGADDLKAELSYSKGITHWKLGWELEGQGREEEAEDEYRNAEKSYKQALEILPAAEGALNLAHIDFVKKFQIQAGLAGVYRDLGGNENEKESERHYQQALSKVSSHDHDRVATIRNNLALLYHKLGRCDDAEEESGKALASENAEKSTRARSHFVQAMTRWKRNQGQDRKNAIDDLKKAIELVEDLRQSEERKFSSAFQRAVFFAEWRSLFERMVYWQAERDPPDEVSAEKKMTILFRAVEQCRGRSLLDQMESPRVNPPTQELRREKEGWEAELAERAEELLRLTQKLQRRQLELQRTGGGQRQELQDLDKQKNELNDELKSQLERVELACEEYDYVEYKIAEGSDQPAQRHEQKLVGLEELKGWAKRQNTLVLEYLLGEEHGHVLVVRPDGQSRAEELTISDKQAEILGVKAGPLTANRMRDALDRDEVSGVIQYLLHYSPPDDLNEWEKKRWEKENESREKEFLGKLRALWRLLVPQAERKEIIGGTYKRLAIVPHACMADLPFEVLVVESGDYLLDAGPPVFYAPSATILMKLAKRKTERIRKDTVSVLTVAVPNIEGFGRIPFVTMESHWVDEHFRKRGFETKQLLDQEATEERFCEAVAGRSILHVANHGMFFPEYHDYGNLIGFLAFKRSADDDGLLMLPELRDLDLKTCELAILSACYANVGQEWGHEGTWSIAREFLGAGAQRVISANAPTADKATANLISVFSSVIARHWDEPGKVDHAGALRKAKQWIRNRPEHPEWKERIFWAPFVLTGAP